MTTAPEAAPVEKGTEDASGTGRRQLLGVGLQEYTLVVVVVVLFVVGAILKPDSFPTADNVRNMLTQASVVGVLAIGMTFVIATAGIDLSVGSMLAAAGMAGGVLVDPEGSTLVFILGAVVFATILGTVNATAIAYGRVVPFIATLAMFSIGRGVALLLNDKLPVSLLDLNGGSFGDPAPFSLLWFGTGRIVGIPVSVYVFLGITIVGWLLLNRTRYGRYVVAVGGNREAAKIAGVPVRRTIFSVYVLSGLLAGVDDEGDSGSADTAQSAGSTSAEEEGSPASGGPVSIVASVPPTDHGWLGAISKNAQAAADEFDDVDFRLLEAADADSQAQQIEQVISDKPDVLVVLPYDGAALTPVAQRAESEGIPVVNVDRLFTAPDAATATILGDNYQIGVLAADYIAGELQCDGNVVEIQGLAGISVTEERSKGFTDELKKKCPDGGVRTVAKQPGDFNPDTGLKVMENVLQAEDQIDAVYTHDDDMAQGVVQAIRNAGREDEMFLTGVGGSQDAMAQIKEGGLYRATFLYNPNMAASAVNMARLLALGEGFSELVPPEVPRQIVVPAATVTQDNVEEYEEYAFN